MEQLGGFGHGLHSQCFIEYVLAAMELSQSIAAAPEGKVGSYQLAMRGLIALVLLEYRCSPFDGIFIAARLQVIVSKCTAHGKIDMARIARRFRCHWPADPPGKMPGTLLRLYVAKLPD